MALKFGGDVERIWEDELGPLGQLSFKDFSNYTEIEGWAIIQWSYRKLRRGTRIAKPMS